MSEIEKAIKKLASKKGAQPTILIGKVTAFDENKWLATIQFNAGFSDDDIRVRAVIDSSESGIFIKPKIGSSVLCAQIEGKLESMVVLTWSDIEHVKFGKTKLDLNGDSFGGLVKSESVANEINALKQQINTLKQLLTSWVPVPTDGGAALKTIISSWSAQQLQTIQKTAFENNTVKHGE